MLGAMSLAHSVYVFCTNFMINIANILGISYIDANSLIFFVLWPATIILLIFAIIFAKIFLRPKAI